MPLSRSAGEDPEQNLSQIDSDETSTALRSQRGGSTALERELPNDFVVNQNEEAKEDDDITIIGLDSDGDRHGEPNAATLAWIQENGPAMQERRRMMLHRELQRVQKASFVHFVLLCLIPTTLLLVMVASVLGDKEDCSSEFTHCAEETRTFINAFTTKCICDAIDVED